jgi:hypothetical protein
MASASHTLLDVSNGGWAAIAAWVGLLLAVMAAVFAFFQFREAQRLRAEQAQPYVVIYTEPTEADPNAVDLIIKNLGATAAKDIEVAIDPPPQMSVGGSVDDVQVPTLIRTLVPGQAWSTFWDTTYSRKDKGLPSHHTATVRFRDSRNHTLGPYTFDLDWDQIIGRGWIVSYGMHQLTDAVRDIRDLIRHRGDTRYTYVLSYSGEEHDRRQREHYEARLRETERRQEQHDEGEAQG